MTDDLVKQLRAAGRAFINNQYNLHTRAADRIETLEQAIRDWADAIVDWEGIDFVERIEDEKSRAVIEAALAGEKKDG